MNAKNDMLKIIGPLIFLCEGTKAHDRKIEIVNSDPFIITTFLDFVRKIMKVPNEKIKGKLEIHNGQNIEKINIYWSKLTKIPNSQFLKPIIKNNTSSTRKRTNLENGTFIVNIFSKELRVQMDQLINGIKSKI
jgi:hypothetical protein